MTFQQAVYIATLRPSAERQCPSCGSRLQYVPDGFTGCEVADGLYDTDEDRMVAQPFYGCPNCEYCELEVAR